MRFTPLNGRTPGGADRARPTVARLRDLPASGSVVVGVVDVGIVAPPHPWFGDHVEDGYGVDVITDTVLRPGDADGHGTFVAGRVLAEAPAARIVMRSALDKADGRGSARLDQDDDVLVTAAVRGLADVEGLAVVNLSFGGTAFDDLANTTNLEAALRDLPPGVAVVASAGNDGADRPVWPAAFKGVIAVGAVDEFLPSAADTPPRASFSNHGWWVDAYATGVEVVGPFVEFTGVSARETFDGWAQWSGTSFAAATVSGRIAQVVIDRGCTGREAAHVVLSESRVIDEHGAVWVNSHS